MDTCLLGLLQAAEQGDSDAQYKLGDLYLMGDGVKPDVEQAIDWYGKAAEQGHTDAQYALGQIFEYGIDVEKDEERAMAWYRKVIESSRKDK